MFSRPHINPGVKRPRTRHCSIVDPSRGTVTPGFLIYQVTSRLPLVTDLQSRPVGSGPVIGHVPSPFLARAFAP